MTEYAGVPIVVAGWYERMILRFFGFGAMVLPGRRILIKEEYLHDASLLAHEYKHIQQMDRDGWLFWPRCFWYLIRYGYNSSPYEIEARAAEGTL
ncbi:MAG: hypothetical protein EB165_03565 [Euryarchaeota archaeon]|jgi:hypothetical protein|nr:hypothetical protein [Euryarchaeota archaeon]